MFPIKIFHPEIQLSMFIAVYTVFTLCSQTLLGLFIIENWALKSIAEKNNFEIATDISQRKLQLSLALIGAAWKREGKWVLKLNQVSPFELINLIQISHMVNTQNGNIFGKDSSEFTIGSSFEIKMNYLSQKLLSQGIDLISLFEWNPNPCNFVKRCN